MGYATSGSIETERVLEKVEECRYFRTLGVDKILSGKIGRVPGPADFGLTSALSTRSRPAASMLRPERPNRSTGPATGQQGASENRVYHGLMAPDTITLPRQATPEALPAPPNPAEPPDLDLLGDRIAKLSARIQAATYELLCDLREFDRHHGWEGLRSCAHWLNWRTGLDLGAAREKLRVAAALADLNHLSAAMACGRLSYSIVRALTRVATPATEARLVAVSCGATAAQVERLVRAWREADRAAQPDAEQVRLACRALSTRVDEDGMLVLRARLTPEVGAVVLRALEAALEQVPAVADDQETGIAQRRADALGLVAESALAGGLDPGNAGDRFQVTVHVDASSLTSQPVAEFVPHISAETRELHPATPEPPAADAAAGLELVEPATVGVHLAAETCGSVQDAPVSGPGPAAGQAVIEQAEGIHVSAEVARRLACDAGRVVLQHGPDGEVRDVGRRTRTIPTALRRALQSRDLSQCQFPGCCSRHCDAHHVVHWADGGETQLTNLVSLCRFHHRAVHEEGFQVVADTAGQFQFLRPDGAPLPAVPPAARWEGAGEPLGPTVARLAAAGVTIGPHTATPEWYGERLDLTAALDVLWEPQVRGPPAASVSAGAS